jgi:putative ABC transport system permease protein
VSTVGLLRRQFVSSPGASLAVVIVVAVCAFLAAAAPRALDALFTAELRYSVDQTGPTKRDLVATSIGSPASSGSDFGPMDSGLAAIREQVPPTLRAAVGEGEWVAVTKSVAAPADEPEPDAPTMRLTFLVDDDVDDVARYVDGAPPTAPVDNGTMVPERIDVALSVQAAADLRWSVGEQRTAVADTGLQVPVVLTGIFDAVDPAADYWQHVPSVLEPYLFDDGNNPPIVTGMALVHPAASHAVHTLSGGISTTAWFPLDTTGLTFGEATQLLQDLRGFTSGAHPIGSAIGEISSLTFRSGLVEALTGVAERSTATTAVVAMVAVGPFGVAIAVLALAARLLVSRRRSGLQLASARGASPAQTRGMMAIEGAILGIPVAALAIVAAVLVIPGAPPPTALAPAVLLGLAPTALFAAATNPRGLRQVRADLDERAPSRFGWIVEVVVVGLAIVSVALLLTRGLVSSTGGVVLDPLLIATPLLLALAACVVVLRLYPVPLAAISARLKRGPKLAGHLGSALALRGSATPVAPVLAMVVGVAIAVFSSVLVSTLDRGTEAAASSSVGADLRADSLLFTPELIATIQDLDGVALTTGVDDAGPSVLRVDRVRDTVNLIVVDFAGLAQFRDGLPAGLTSEVDGAVPVLASDDLVAELEADADLLVEGEPVVIVGSADRATGIAATTRWMMVDASFSQALLGLDFRPGILLVDATADADLTAIAEAIITASGPTTEVTTPAELTRELLDAPTVAGLRVALLVGILVALGLAGVAVAMTFVAGSRTRGRLLSLLSTLGLSARQAGGLAAWELAPTAIVAVAVGTLLGLALPWIVLGAVDLRPFTGGGAQPAIEVPALVVLGVIAAFTAMVAIATAAATAAGRRVSAAATLRMGEE